MRRRLFPLGFVAVAFLLQLDLLFVGKSVEIYRNEDENWYGIVLDRLETMGCETGIPVTFVHQERRNFHSCEFFKVLNALTPTTDPIAKALWLKAWGRVLALGLFSLLSWILLRTPWTGLLIGAWNLVDPGIRNFKPAAVLFANLAEGVTVPFTQAMRFISPAHYFLPGAGAALCLLAWVAADRRGELTRRKLLLLGAPLAICLFLLALTPFYTWLPFYYLYGCIALYALQFSRPEVKKAIAFALAAGLALALAYVGSKTGVPHSEEALARSGFLKGFREPVFLFHKGLWLASVVTGVISYLVFERRVLPAFGVALGFFTLLNVNLLTGLELQNFHFKDYLGAFYLSALVLFTAWRWPAWRRRGAVAVVAVIAAGMVHQALSLARHPNGLREPGRLADHAEVIAYVRSELAGKRGFCGPWNLQLPVLARASCYYHHLLMTYPLSDLEVLEMTMIRFRLLGLAPEEVKETLLAAHARAIVGDWNFGVRPEWVSQLPLHARYWREAPRFIPRWVEEYRAFPDERLERAVEGFDFLILKKSHPLVRSGVLRPLREFGEFGVYRPAVTARIQHP